MSQSSDTYTLESETGDTHLLFHQILIDFNKTFTDALINGVTTLPCEMSVFKTEVWQYLNQSIYYFPQQFASERIF